MAEFLSMAGRDSVVEDMQLKMWEQPSPICNKCAGVYILQNTMARGRGNDAGEK